MTKTLNHIQLFEHIQKIVPAYSKFLDESKYPQLINQEKFDWKNIPQTNKANYIKKFPMFELISNDHNAPLGHVSSGSTGSPTFFLRGEKSKKIGIEYYRKIIDEMMHISPDEKTLVLVCFGLGTWIAGMYTFLCFEQITQSSKNMYLMSPGMNVNDICSTLEHISLHFEHIIFMGYPAALDLAFEKITVKNINLPKVHIITAGDKISEQWRKSEMERFNIQNITSVVNAYGSAEGGIMAIETPLSIEIRLKILSDQNLSTKVFGKWIGSDPALFQYDPQFFYFEENNGELIMTADLDLPLVRYNLHDSGKVFTYKEMKSSLNLEIDNFNDKKWNYPFLVLFDRLDIGVIIYGAKLYPENIKKALLNNKMSSFFTGSFLAFILDTENGPLFCLDIETLDSESTMNLDDESALPLIIQNLLNENCSEYRYVCLQMGKERVKPNIRLVSKIDILTFEETNKLNSTEYTKGCYLELGKKPRIVPVKNQKRK